ncbi:MAG: hypothetical protein VX293_01495 [Candidatus Latescibacterota bacterium]|nr:hypothetical protein [Candidatus Latescibacterota bacterium]
MTSSTYQAEVAARTEQILHAAHESGSDRSLWGAHALMPHKPAAAEIVEIVRNHLWRKTDSPASGLLGGPFEILPCMLLLCRWEHELPTEATALIRDFMTQAHLERGNTENHWLMAYGGMLLAAERWPDADFAWSGLRAAAIAAEATRWISGIIERSAVQGHHEYDSTGYHIEHMTAYIGLYEHAHSAELRAQIENMLTLLVADMALEYFNGAWAGGHSREGYRQNTWTRLGPIQPLQYLYFGGIDFDHIAHTHGFAIPSVVASYRPPALFAEMAWDRAKAHVVKKTKAPRTIYRHAREIARPVRKYTYMSRSFALGSTQLGLPGTQCGPIDLTAWDLTWDGPNHQAIVACNHPYNSPDRFSAFLHGFPQHIGRSIATGKPYLQWPDRLFGASPYERMLQHEGGIVVLYDIPQRDAHPFVNIFLPHGQTWSERGGWIFADAGDFHIGLYAIGPYEWTDILEANNANILVREGDLIDGWLLRIHSRTAGLVVEVVEADEVESFAHFCRQRVALVPDLSGWPDDKRVQVQTTAGHALDITHDGAHRVDGEEVDYDAYPLYAAPGVEAPLGTGRVKFAKNGDEVAVDFGIDPNKPLLPMRVIG